MLRIGVGYILLVCSLSLYKYNNKDNECVISANYNLLSNSMFIVPLIGIFFQFKLFSTVYCLILCTIYICSLEFMNNILYLICLAHDLQYDIMRYFVYYMYVILSIKDYDEGIHRLPYCGVISNFGFVIENRMFDCIENTQIKNLNLTFIPIISLTFGYIFLLLTKAKFEKSQLYNDITRYRRMFIKSSILFCSLSTTLLINKHIDIDNLKNHNWFDLIPIITSFLLIILNQQYLKYIPFWGYRYFGIIVNLSLTVLYMFFFDNHYFQKVCIVLSWGIHFMITDPSRYMFYILHSLDIIPYFLAGDVLAVTLAKFAYDLNLPMYVNYIILAYWMVVSTFSIKYHTKDKYCARCVNVLEV